MKRTALRSGSHLSRSEIRREAELRPVNPKRRRNLYARNFGAYADLIREMPCCTCGAPGPSDPHHARSRGAGGDRRDLCPLCRDCHRILHQIGRATFEARHGVDLATVAAALWERYGGGEG
jgi:hypothetical protein